MSEEKRKVYHYLHNSASGATDAEWKTEKLIIKLPDLLGNERMWDITVDPRDQRTLVVFDGHIPWGGIPKGGDIVFSSYNIQSICTNVKNMRKPRFEEEARTECFSFQNGSEIAVLPIKRNFLLLPKSTACVRKYRADSLSPIYVMIEINEKGVTWRNSSY